MQLTTAQNTTLKNSILADPALNTLPANSASADLIATAYNALYSPATQAWWSAVPIDDIHNSIDYSKYTPTEIVNDADADALVYKKTARLLSIQTKQMNLQNMLIGRTTIDASKTNVRAGLRDAVIQLPAGTAGAMVTAAGSNAVTLLTACLRPTNVTKAEKLFSSGPATTGTVTADVLPVEGFLNIEDVKTAMGW